MKQPCDDHTDKSMRNLVHHYLNDFHIRRLSSGSKRARRTSVERIEVETVNPLSFDSVEF
jgi:hypothetical protein